MIKKLPKDLCDSYISVLSQHGQEYLYKCVVDEGMERLDKIETADNILDFSDSFFALYKKIGQEEYFTIGKILRKAAHVIYRQLQLQNNSDILNRRFINRIK
jgi:hypothetical protein